MAIFGVVGFSAVLACNGIIGLSDFERVECTANRCDASFDVVTPVPPPTGVPPPSEAGPGSEPVSWARWPMPNYDAGVPNAPSLTVDGDAVTDNVTHLVWKRDLALGGRPVTFAEAQTACTGGFRLPKRIELVSLLDYTHGTPFIMQQFNVANTRVWTSSAARHLSGTQMWSVNFDNGAVNAQESSGKLQAAVLCVKDK